MKRIAVIGAIVLVLVIGGGVYFLLSSLDSVVKAAVEKVGSDATGTEVTLGAVEISPTSGKGALRRFRMTNPAGFREGDAFRFDEVSIAIDVATLASDPVIVKEIVVIAPAITYAIGAGTTNVDEIKTNVDAYAGTADGGTKGGNSGEAGPKIVIEHLYMRQGTVHVSMPELIDKTLSAPLPDIHLTDIGKDSGGATPGEVARQTIESVVAAATQAVRGLNLDSVLEGAGALADKARLGGAAEGAEGAAKEAGDAVGDATKGAGDQLKKLLK